MTKAQQKELTIHDVARQAGVSPSTVSRVINGTARVEPKKAKRVRDVIQALGYTPNPLARGLLGRGTRTVGVLVPELEDQFYGQVVTGLERQLRTRGLHMLCSLGHGNLRDEQAALDLFHEQQVDGLILIVDHLSDDALLHLSEGQKPLVLVNRLVPELSAHCARLDNFNGGYLATRHLLDLGHRRVAHISGLLERPGARERLDGYREALRDSGIDFDDTLVVEGDFTEGGGQLATERLLRRATFTAIFAANDRMAIGALQAMRAEKKAVPEEISIVGFDDRDFARFAFPSLTTVRYPVMAIGAQAADHLASLIAGNPVEPIGPFTPALIVRDSSAPVKEKR